MVSTRTAYLHLEQSSNYDIYMRRGEIKQKSSKNQLRNCCVCVNAGPEAIPERPPFQSGPGHSLPPTPGGAWNGTEPQQSPKYTRGVLLSIRVDFATRSN